MLRYGGCVTTANFEATDVTSPRLTAATTRLDQGYSLLRLVVALLLCAAAALKGYDLATGPVSEEGILTSRWFLIGLVELELLFSLWILANVLPMLTWTAALMCFATFTCASIYKALSGDASCGCFGRVPVNPWYTAALDLTIVLSLLRWRPPGCGLRTMIRSASHVRQFPIVFGQQATSAYLKSVRIRVAAILILWLAIGLPAVHAMSSYTPATMSETGSIFGSDEVVVFEPEKWIGKRLPLLNHIDVGNQLRKGQWRVLLYHHDCPQCRETIRAYVQCAQGSTLKSDFSRIALVEIPPYGDSINAMELERTTCLLAKLNSTKTWFVETPVWLVIQDGDVVAVDHG